MPILACILCSGHLKNPVSIPCGHIACAPCLSKYIHSLADGQLAICLTCRRGFPIPDGPTGFFQEEFYAPIRPIILDTPLLSPYLDRIAELEAHIASLTDSNAALTTDNERLTDECKAVMEANDDLQYKEKEAMSLAGEVQDEHTLMQSKYERLLRKYKAAKLTNAAPVRQPKAEVPSPSKSGTYGCKHLLSDSESSDEDVGVDSRVSSRPSTSIPDAKRRRLGAPDAKVGSSSHRPLQHSPISPTHFDPSGARLSSSGRIARPRRERPRK